MTQKQPMPAAAKPDPQAADLRGVVLDGRYEIGETLSEGGMGTVYRGQQLALRRPVAIKVVKPGITNREVQVRRLVREAQTTAMVKHPNVIEIIDTGVMQHGFVYLVMEQLEGQDLRALLRKERRLPWPRVRGIAMQVVAALKAAHACGVIHRDIKPSNVFMVDQAAGVRGDFIKVLDFGLAKCRAQGRSSTLTGADEVVGTAAYLAPEVARGRKADFRSEVYAVGVLMYKMATGTVPFKGTNPLDVLAKAISNPVPAPRSHNPQLPEEADRIIRRCLAKRPDLRPQTMDDLEQDLHALGTPIVSETFASREVGPAAAPAADNTQVAPVPLAPPPSAPRVEASAPDPLPPPRPEARFERREDEDPSDVLEAAISEVLDIDVDEVFAPKKLPKRAPKNGRAERPRPALHLVPEPEPNTDSVVAPELPPDPLGPTHQSGTAVAPIPHRPNPPGSFAADLPRDERGFAPALSSGALGIPVFEPIGEPEPAAPERSDRKRFVFLMLAVPIAAAVLLGGLFYSGVLPMPGGDEPEVAAASVVADDTFEDAADVSPVASIDWDEGFRATPEHGEPQVYAPDTFTPPKLRRPEPGSEPPPVLEVTPEPEPEPVAVAPRKRSTRRPAKRPRKRPPAEPSPPPKPASRPPPPPPNVPSTKAKKKPKGDPSAPWKRVPVPSDNW